MTPTPIQGYKVEDGYLISGGRIYRLQLLNNDEEIAKSYNGGDAIPIMKREVESPEDAWALATGDKI